MFLFICYLMKLVFSFLYIPIRTPIYLTNLVHLILPISVRFPFVRIANFLMLSHKFHSRLSFVRSLTSCCLKKSQAFHTRSPRRFPSNYISQVSLDIFIASSLFTLKRIVERKELCRRPISAFKLKLPN